MSRRGWVGWLEEHRGVVAGAVLWSVLSLTAVLVVRFETPEVPASVSSTPERATPSHGERSSAARRASSAKRRSAARPPAAERRARRRGADAPATRVVPPQAPVVPGTASVPACVPRPPRTQGGVAETGVSPTAIRIGQIITDSANLPGQFRPAHEGLAAYVELVNDHGGICGRRLLLDVSNDNSNPSTHDYVAMAQRVFAFVGNFSLLDGQDYESGPPFLPRYRDGRTGEFVPDVGGLAFAYGRAQSPVHAGVIGSVSPVLIGGGQPRYFIREASAAGRPCRRAGTVYLVEPSGASRDQAELGKAALEARWGGNLGRGNVRTYSASLGAPDLVYRGIVQNMVRDGVNCVFSYTDVASNINLARALYQEGVWPPDRCSRLVREECFGVVWVPFTAYDPEFVRGAGVGARHVSSFVPHVPLNETANPALRAYLAALARLRASDARYRDAEPSTFSLLGFASGMMFVEALRGCAGAPTRACVLARLQAMRGFTAGGLLGGTTPFRTTRTAYGSYGVYDWKWIFNTSVAVRVLGSDANPLHRWRRVRPRSGFFSDTIHVAR